MTRILATGDFQLGVHGRLADQAAVLDRIADLAVDRHVDLVLDAGDTFEGPSINPEELDVFARFVARLRDAGIPVLATLGNGRHDRAVRETHGLAIFDHIDGVTVAPRPDLYRYPGVIVATLPWVHPGRLIAKQGGGDRDEINADVTAKLLQIARGLQRDCFETDSSVAHVLLAHWHVDQATSANGGRVGDLFQEPLLPLYELNELGFDAVVLGHNHRGQLLTDDPPVFHVGSPLPHDFGEAEFSHGVWLLEIEGVDATGAEFVPVESRRLLTIGEQLGAHDQYGLELACTPDAVRDAIVRVRLDGTAQQLRSFDLGQLRRAIANAGASEVKIVPNIEREDRARVDGVDETLAPLAALDLWIQANDQGERGDQLRARTARYLEAAA